MIDEIDKTLTHWFTRIVLKASSKRYRRRNRKRLKTISFKNLELLLYKERYWLNKNLQD